MDKWTELRNDLAKNIVVAMLAGPGFNHLSVPDFANKACEMADAMVGSLKAMRFQESTAIQKSIDSAE